MTSNSINNTLMKASKISIYIDYILLTFFILISGGGFTYGMFNNWAYILFPVVLYIYLNRGYKISNKMVLVVMAFALLHLLHALMWHAPITSTVQATLIIFTLVLFARIIYPNFNRIFVNIILFFAVTSLVIWCISMTPAGYKFMLNFSQGLPQYGIEKLWEVAENENMYTCYLFSYYTFFQDNLLANMVRNPGPFWEPGRFTIYLTIALMLRIYNNPKNLFDKTNIILLLANITTFSTTGYIALIILFFGYIMISKKSTGTKTMLILLISIFASYILQLDFMSDKISYQANDLGNTQSRFGAMAYQLAQIAQSPIIGYGAHIDKAFSILEISPNGWTSYMRYVGIPMFIAMMVFLYKGTKAYIHNNNRLMSIFAFTIILTLAFTQTCMNDPFYYIMYFMVFNAVSTKTTSIRTDYAE